MHQTAPTAVNAGYRAPRGLAIAAACFGLMFGARVSVAEPREGEASASAAAPSLAAAPAPLTYDNRLRLLAAPLRFDGEPLAGVVGLGFDLPVHEYWRLGVSGMRAVRGDRAGFYTAGFHGGLHVRDESPLGVEASLFVGAAGGGGTPTRGLALMPSAGVFVDLSDVTPQLGAVGVYAARLMVPSSSGGGTNLVLLAADFPWPALSAPGDRLGRVSGLEPDRHGVAARTVRATWHAYVPVSSQEGRGGRDHRVGGVAGFEYRMQLLEPLFASIDARGALFSHHAGYSELTVGAGAHYPPASRVRLWARAGVGGAGGGGVDVGGGLLARGALGLDADIPGPVHVGADMGLVDAPLGELRALAAGVRVGVSENVVRRRPFGARALAAEDVVGWRTLRVRPSHRTVFGLAQRNGEDVTSQLLGLKLDYLFGPHFYLSGQAAGSYDTAASGFVTGSFAAGLRSPPWHGLRLVGEMGAGAAGGGRADIGYGLWVQPTAGVNYALTESIALELLGGWAVAPQGGVSSPLIDAGLVYSFSTPTLRGAR